MKTRKIQDNALKAQLRTPMFKMQQQAPKKGKGSYSRKGRKTMSTTGSTTVSTTTTAMQGYSQAA